MAKFSFRLQNVLNLKVRLEDQQRNVFAAAQKKLNEEEEKLNNLYLRKESYEEKGRQMREKTLHLQDILENETAITRVKEYIEDQKARVRLQEKKVEDERAKLVEMIKERKMYERLREKAFENYLEEEKHTEGVENDEHNSYVYGVRGANG